jgi:O-antigen/teichoic acid export membrane protein
MKLERSKNTARNFIFGTITKLYNILVPFLMRTALIYCLGMQYVGLNSLFTSVLSVLNLAELGVGSALVFSMYEPLANDDREKICALMQLYKIYYRVIGLVILVIGIAFTPFLPYLVKGDIPSDMNLYVLYYINLASTVVTYWLFAYKNCLLNVHQRSDIIDKTGYIVNTLRYALQLIVLFWIKDYYIYIIVSLFFDIVYNITVSIVVDKIYPQYKAYGKLSKTETSAINRRVRDLFTAKIGGVISNSADTVVISAFLGLTQLAIYQNYFYVVNSLLGFITVITSSSRAGIGNSIITETNEKNLNDLNKLTFMFSWIGIFCTSSLISLFQPFIELWVGEDNLLPYSMVITFCVYFFVTEMMNLLLIYKDASGIWHQDRFRPLITSLTNLGVNLILVQFWGLYGILLSTVISILFVGMPWLLKNLFSTVFHCSSKKYTFSLIKYTLLAIVLTAISAFATSYITFNSLILTLILRGVFCVIFPNLVLFIIFRKSNQFKQLVNTLVYVSNGKLKFLNKLI